MARPKRQSSGLAAQLPPPPESIPTPQFLGDADAFKVPPLTNGRPKRQSSSMASQAATTAPVPMPPMTNGNGVQDSAPKRGRPKRTSTAMLNPDTNPQVVDGQEARQASPDADEPDEKFQAKRRRTSAKKVDYDEESVATPELDESEESALSEMSEVSPPPKPKGRVTKLKAAKPKAETKSVKIEPEAETASAPPVKKKADEQPGDPEGDEDFDEDPAEIQEAAKRPQAVNSDYLPLPWKGRLGYACLCTYLRYSNPPVFASRTCRIASILENRHPLQFPDQPPHPTKNRPDRSQPADVARGQAYVESLGVANARDVIKMLRWNDKYNIKFLRLSSEMFPFASHEEYGYKLAPFASEVLGEVGKVAAELGHRLTTHPGQFTQLGSPRKVVIDNAIRDLEFHAEMLSLLKLPEQQNKDAVMILHLGGVFGDKDATIARFKENYKSLPQGIKDRLVLENDDVSYSVHDLLPICEELNIPMVLDFHHSNIIFDATQIREGTKDIVDLYPRILQTWRRKGITPKMHYSEPTPGAITGRNRRKHNPRVASLPPCPPDMDLMIEAKDKEQAVFELMRTFKLPGHERIADMIPNVRLDDNKPAPRVAKKKTPKKSKKKDEDDEPDEEEVEPVPPAPIPEEEVGMGGPEGRVYWPPGCEDWLRPVKRVVKKKDDTVTKGPPRPGDTKRRKAAEAAAKAAAEAEGGDEDREADEGLTDASIATTPGMTTATIKAIERMNAVAKEKAKKAKTNGVKKEVKEEDVDVDMDGEEEVVPKAKGKKKVAKKNVE